MTGTTPISLMEMKLRALECVLLDRLDDLTAKLEEARLYQLTDDTSTDPVYGKLHGDLAKLRGDFDAFSDLIPIEAEKEQNSSWMQSFFGRLTDVFGTQQQGLEETGRRLEERCCALAGVVKRTTEERKSLDRDVLEIAFDRSLDDAGDGETTPTATNFIQQVHVLTITEHNNRGGYANDNVGAEAKSDPTPMLQWWFGSESSHEQLLQLQSKQSARAMLKTMAKKIVLLTHNIYDLPFDPVCRPTATEIVQVATKILVPLSRQLRGWRAKVWERRMHFIMQILIPILYTVHRVTKRVALDSVISNILTLIREVKDFIESLEANDIAKPIVESMQSGSIAEHGLTACVAPVQPGTAPSADAKFDEIVDLLKANSDLMQIVDIASLIRRHDEAVIAKANERVYGALPDGQDYQSESSVISVFQDYNIRFVATDVNENDIKRAKLGGYAENWPGTLRLTGEAVAVKSLRSDVAIRRRIFRTIREGVVWAPLRHHNILPLIGYTIARDVPALVSSYQPLGSLLDHRGKNLRMTTKLDLLSGIADAVSYLHRLEAPVIHGDIRSANVLINSLNPARALLCDFGISTFPGMDKTLHTIDMITNVRWHPYEFIGMQSIITTAQSDMFAFGCLILEALSEQNPYYDYDLWNDSRIPLALANKEHPHFPPNINNEHCKALMLRSWAIDPMARPSADLVREELERIRVELAA